MQAEAGAPLSATDHPSATPHERRALFGVLVVVAVTAYALDLASKAWAVANLSDGQQVGVLGDLISLRLIRNPGAAFSLGTGNTWVLTVLAIVILVVTVRASRRIGSLGWAWALGLLLGGALGNLTDRLAREPGFGRGHVVDFIDYRVFIGNLADIAIVSAAVLIGLLTLRGVALDGSRTTGE
jgi:signal peptidase II